MKIFKKHGFVNSFLRERPKLYDQSRIIGDSISENKAEYFQVFKRLTNHYNGKINFVQIGANDGLRNDPVRDFVVRYDWSGVLVEPLPYSFQSLVKNYSYLDLQSVFFENVAIGEDDQPDLDFWSYKDSFLDDLSHEQKEGYRRKSSFIKDHLLKFLPEGNNGDGIVESIPVKIMSVKTLMAKYGMNHNELNLLAVDAEGFDHLIIESTLKDNIKPEVIYFESHHSEDNEPFFDKLRSFGYVVEEYRRDSIAIIPELSNLL
ncbi:MAG: FkbM family methyltransferase [Cyclobacteriaceae bacterium]